MKIDTYPPKNVLDLPIRKNILLVKKYGTFLAIFYRCSILSNVAKYSKSNYEVQISINRTDFVTKHKLSPVNLTWLSQVYGKMFFFPIG